MSAILKVDFQKRGQLRSSEVDYLNYTKKDPFFHVATTFSLKQGETKTSHGPVPHPLNNSFSDRNVFHDGVNALSKTVLKVRFYVKKLKISCSLDHVILFNFTSMWYKHF